MVLAKAERSMNQLKCNIASDFQCLRCSSFRVLLQACPACSRARARLKKPVCPHLLTLDLHPAGKQKSASLSPHSRRSTSATSRPRSSSTIVEREL